MVVVFIPEKAYKLLNKNRTKREIDKENGKNCKRLRNDVKLLEG